MKYVQIGILAALVVVAVLLFNVYQGKQTSQAPSAAVEQVQPAPSEPAAAEAPPAPVPPEPVAHTAGRSSPARGPAPVSKPSAAPAQTAATPPAPAPTPTPAEPGGTPALPKTASPVQPPERPVAKELPPPPPRKVTLESGALIPVRLSEGLSTDRVQTGETFAASLDKPIVVDGFVIAERGARVEGRVVDAVQAGRVKGLAQLGIQLVSLRTSDGQTVAIQTDTFTKQGPATKQQDAAKVGVGAGLGAAIGAIAGGGKGAAIGAAVGGAAGAGTVAATRGKPAELPSETRIEFRLSNSVTVTESGR